MIGDTQAFSDVEVSVKGDWMHNVPSSPAETVSEFTSHPDFWEHRFGQPTREEMTEMIAAAGEIAPAYSLTARSDPPGKIRLIDGCHRWAIARTRIPDRPRHNGTRAT